MSLNVSKHIYDDAATTAVQEAIAGLLITRGDLKLVAGTKNVLVRADIEAYRNKYVTIICGGGSGHEPAHAGYCNIAPVCLSVCLSSQYLRTLVRIVCVYCTIKVYRRWHVVRSCSWEHICVSICRFRISRD